MIHARAHCREGDYGVDHDDDLEWTCVSIGIQGKDNLQDKDDKNKSWWDKSVSQDYDS